MKIVDKQATAKKSDTLIVFDETVKGSLGDLRLLVEYPRTTANAEKYWSALRDARNIPFDLEAINPLDPMYKFVLEKFPDFRGFPDKLKARVKFYYEEQSRQAYRDAIMLAVVSPKENKFSFEPTPYTEEDFDTEEELPGLVSPPRVTHNLDNASEHRLKQLYDFLKADPALLIPFTRNFELAVIKINELLVDGATDDAGFQPVAVSEPQA